MLLPKTSTLIGKSSAELKNTRSFYRVKDMIDMNWLALLMTAVYQLVTGRL